MTNGSQSQQSLFAPSDDQKTGMVSFDLETQRTFHELEGKRDPSKLKMSVGVIRHEDTDEFDVFREDDVDELIDLLFSAETVIGYNLKSFDYGVLEPYTPLSFSEVSTLDMMTEIEKELDRRIKLDDVARATLGSTKSADGLQAVRWFREGKMDRIIDYCREDVRITSEVYRFGRDHGHIKVPRHDESLRVQVDWE